MMKKTFRILFLCVATAILASCGTTSTVPITGRKQTLMVSDEQVLSLSNQQYQEYMKTAKASANATNTAMVKRVGQNLATAVVKYLNANGLGAEVSQYQWEFNLVQDQQVNAFCMPGGKIVVYEGLLPVTQNEASLAMVLGHEIAHAVAKHSAERLSNEYKKQYGTGHLGAVLQGAAQSRHPAAHCTGHLAGWSALDVGLLAQAGERGRPHGPHLCGYGRLRPAGGHSLLAAHGCSGQRAAARSSATTLPMPTASRTSRAGCPRR